MLSQALARATTHLGLVVIRQSNFSNAGSSVKETKKNWQSALVIGGRETI